MCSNYEPVTALDRLLGFFDSAPATDAPAVESEVWPLGLAPFIRLRQDGQRVAESGQFGLLPAFAKEFSYGRRTYNARSETVAILASFRASWAKGWRCIVPAEAIYEPNWETGKAVRWRIQQTGAVPMGIAGVYARHPSLRDKEGRAHWSFAMLTINADGHPVFQRMHKPGEEKRMVVILSPDDYDGWLTCAVPDAPRYFQQWTGPLEAFPAPLPRRAAKSATQPRSDPPASGDLF